MLREYAKEQDIKIPGDKKTKVDVAAHIDSVEAERKAAAEETSDDSNGSSDTANASDDTSAGDEAPREGSASGPSEGSGLQPGTGTVRIEPDGSQTVVQPREGSDQRPGDRIVSEGYLTTDEAPDLKAAIEKAKA
jgi:hypothetical protein